MTLEIKKTTWGKQTNPHGQFFDPQTSAGINLKALSTKCGFYRNSNHRSLTCNQTWFARSFSIRISASESSVHEFHLIYSNLNSLTTLTQLLIFTLDNDVKNIETSNNVPQLFLVTNVNAFNKKLTIPWFNSLNEFHWSSWRDMIADVSTTSFYQRSWLWQIEKL